MPRGGLLERGGVFGVAEAELRGDDRGWRGGVAKVGGGASSARRTYAGHRGTRAGDDSQAAKAGLLEGGGVFAVAGAELPDADDRGWRGVAAARPMRACVPGITEAWG